MKEKKNRIGRKLVLILLLLFSTIILLLLAGSYITHNREIDRLQKDRIRELAVTTASLLDGDFLEELSRTVSSEEYQALRARVTAGEDPSILENFLKERDLYAEFTRAVHMLDILQDGAKVEYLYVMDVDKAYVTYLLNPSEPILYLGAQKENTGEFASALENEFVTASVRHTENGWLCTCAEPVKTSGGSSSAIVGADLNMSDIIGRRHRFALIMILQSAGVLVLMALLGTWYIRKTISDPLRRLARDASSFGAGSGSNPDGLDEEDSLEVLETQVITVPDRKKDEIRDLYEDIRTMQRGILLYMRNLTAVTEEKERIGTELDIANRIQSSMLPSTFPAFPERAEFDVYATMRPAKSVAGDFYDFFLIDPDHLGIVMADVSGKGIPASLFMMMAKIILSSIAQMNLPPHEVLELANERICMNNDADMFVTVWFGIMTLSTGHIIASNAGHEYPVLQNEDGDFELFHDRHGFVLGGMSGVHYKDYEFDLPLNRTLFLYTDGVPEATTAENEQFGPVRMVEALNRRQNANPQELVEYMLRTVDAFDGDVPQFDDITMLALRYKGPAGRDPDEEIDRIAEKDFD